MKAVRPTGTFLLRGAAWGALVLSLALLMTAGYKIGETFALNNAEEYLEIASISPCLEAGRTREALPSFRLRFTEPLKASLVNEYHFSLLRADSNMRIPLKIAWDGSTRTATLAVKRALEADQEYVLEVNPDLVSTKNHRLIAAFKRKIRVEATK